MIIGRRRHRLCRHCHRRHRRGVGAWQRVGEQPELLEKCITWLIIDFLQALFFVRVFNFFLRFS